jgi:hypothetical protein
VRCIRLETVGLLGKAFPRQAEVTTIADWADSLVNVSLRD